MWVNQIFSLIQDGTIQNIVVCDNYTVANDLARLTYGEDAIAVDTTLYPVSIGCKYSDGLFYTADGATQIINNPTEAEEINMLKAENSALKTEKAEAEAEIDFRLSMIELGLV